LPEHIDITKEGYVGIATDFKQRMFAHKSCAKTGKEQTLYKAIRKYGWDNLVKEIILISNDDYCIDVEKKLRPSERIGWNIACGGGEITGFHFKGKKQSPEHLANRRKALIGRVSGMKGKKHTEAAKEKCKLANIGKPKTKEHKQKNSDAHKKRIEVNGVVYDSWSEASKILGVPIGSWSYLIQSKPATRKYCWIKTCFRVL